MLDADKNSVNAIAEFTKSFWFKLLPIAVFIFIWEVTSRAGIVNTNVFPPPSSVFVALTSWALSGELWADFSASFGRMIAGLLIGGVLGILLGMLSGRSRIVNSLLTPLIQLFRPQIGRASCRERV